MASISNITIDIRTAELLGHMLLRLDFDSSITAADAFTAAGKAMSAKHRAICRPKEVQDDLNLLIKLHA